MLRPTEDLVCADAPPHDVWLTRFAFCAVYERCSAVCCPRHLEHSVVAMNTFQTQTAPWRTVVMKVIHEFSDGREERFLMISVEGGELAPEQTLPFVRRHVGSVPVLAGADQSEVPSVVASDSAASRSPARKSAPDEKTGPRLPAARSSAICCSPACHSSVQYHHWLGSRSIRGRSKERHAFTCHLDLACLHLSSRPRHAVASGSSRDHTNAASSGPHRKRTYRLRTVTSTESPTNSNSKTKLSRSESDLDSSAKSGSENGPAGSVAAAQQLRYP